jgi:hypothetical protein
MLESVGIPFFAVSHAHCWASQRWHRRFFILPLRIEVPIQPVWERICSELDLI